MANIKTRILLRNDELSNWQASNSVELKKGEVGIAMLSTGLAEIRVGDADGTKWANARKLNVDISQIGDLLSTIDTEISSKSFQYQLVEDSANQWKLQAKTLDGDAWTDVSTISATLTAYALSADVVSLVQAVSAETLTSANAYTDDAIEDLSGTVDTLVADVSAATLDEAKDYTDDEIAGLSIDNYMLTADFNALSNEIGLSAASSSNPVVTKNDIADLAGAMHFKGAVDSLASITSADPGDIVIIPSTSKEYVYNGSAEAAYSVDNWVELGDEVLYATKAEVATVSADLSTDYTEKINGLAETLNTVSSDYLTSSDKTELVETIATTSADAITSANAYTDEQIAALNIDDYALSSDVTTLVSEVSAETLVSANAYTDDAIEDLSGTVDTLVADVSADTLSAAKDYTDEAVAALSIDDYIKHGEVTSDDLSGFFVLDCGTASYREGEAAATE